MMIKKIGVLVVVALVGFGGAVFAQAPQVLNFQGRLHDSAGNPVTDGDYTIEFRIYTSEMGGTPVWNQAQTVTVTDGVFNVLLDNVDINLSTSTYYLTLKVGSDSEMTPRQRITSLGLSATSNASVSPYWEQNGNNIYYNDGNVGIGTANPGEKLDVVGNIRVNNSMFSPGRLHIGGGEFLYLLNQSGVIISKSWGGTGNLAVDGIINTGEFQLYDNVLAATGRMHIAGGENLYILNQGGVIISKSWGGNGNLIVDGKVGIGTASPGYTLHVDGTIRAEGSDIAEPFDMTDIETLEMGDVVVIDPANPLHVRRSITAYDTMVAGIVSSNEQAGYIAGGRSDGTSDKPIALAGRVLCKVSTENGPIQVGDLLTSSNTPGHAMKATEKDRMIGALLGKALQAFDGETGKIIVLVALQ